MGPPEPLPTVVFQIVPTDTLIPAGITDRPAESYGFNSLNASAWDQGRDEEGDGDGRYLRWLQPMESELARQVEYDMDEQDQIWLDAYNQQRKRDGLPQVSYEAFEIVMDKLEKEWFDLTKSIPKKSNGLPFEDSKCAICDDGECENSNAIVFCDGCNLAVHQDCYGVPYIPEGQWLCRKCTVSPDKPVTCVLCPNSYGAFKQTTTAQWAHLLCAIWIPDTGVSNTVYMEPVDGVEGISKNRWKLICYLCRRRIGACIQCANRNCFQAFHVTCAREHGLELKMKQGSEKELRAFCEKHSENFTPSGSPGPSYVSSLPAVPFKRSHKRKSLQDLVGPAPMAHSRLTLTLKPKSNKSARAYKKSYSSGPPLVPAFVYDRLLEYVSRIKLAKKPAFVSEVCRYWSLKREARRGAPLLKRLHLEPWTASATSRHQTDVEKAKKLELIRLLRNDLEKVRMLTERVRKREKKKLERVILLQKVVDELVFGKEVVFRDVLARVALLDKHHIFAHPVSRLDVPDYHSIVKFPMDWSTMAEKLDRHEYLTAVDFQDDIELVINNARMYNKSDTPVHKSAIRVREAAESILADLEDVDRPDSVSSRHAKQVAELLDTDMLERLFDYQYDPPAKVEPIDIVPKEAVAVKARGKAKKRVSEAGEGEGEGETATPKKRRTEAELMQDAAAPTPVASSRANPRDGATAPGTEKSKRKKKVVEPAEEVKVKGEEEKKPVQKGKGKAVEEAPKSAVEAMEIDRHESFMLFESGWVLPEGSSRRRTGAPEVVVPLSKVVPPPKVVPAPKAKASTSAQPLPASFATKSKAPVVSVVLPAPAVQSTPKPQSRKGKEKAVDQAAPLDTGRARAASNVGSVKTAGQGSSKAALDAMDVDVAEEDVKMSPIKGSKIAAGSDEKRDFLVKLQQLSPLVAVTEKTKLGNGELVWAKTKGYPSYPAEVTDPELDSTPQILLDQKPKGLHSNELILVMFFDTAGKGAWCRRKDLTLLAENQEFDDLMQSPMAVIASQKKGKKGPATDNRVTEIIKAYVEATKNIEIPSDLIGQNTKPRPSPKKRIKKA